MNSPAAPDPARPSSYPRRVLVGLTGLTPQVFTETLYALLKQDEPFLPTELHVVTTEEGRRRLLQLLLHPVNGLSALWAQHGRGAPPTFDPQQHVHVVREADRSLDDVVEAGHQVGTADTILEVLRPLAPDPCCAIHASIAGGRKSMSFYMGYVMSLLAREQDRMSHVLVNAPFESLPGFSFPPLPPGELPLPDGGRVSTVEARVTLSPVAFVHLYERLPRQLLERRLSFQDLVEHAEIALARPQLVVDLSRCKVAVRSPGRAPVVVSLSRGEMALYAYLAQMRRQAPPAEGDAEPGLVVFRTVKGRTDLTRIERPVLARIAGSLDLHPEDLLRDVWGYPPARNEVFNGIKSKLSAAMSERLFFVVRVWGPTERGRGKDGGYGLLGLEPGQIHFGNSPEA